MMSAAPGRKGLACGGEFRNDDYNSGAQQGYQGLPEYLLRTDGFIIIFSFYGIYQEYSQ
ncbi:hypothetical protein JW906_04685 [bacterium]|nr:hypothetical protein [bacterium]